MRPRNLRIGRWRLLARRQVPLISAIVVVGPSCRFFVFNDLSTKQIQSPRSMIAGHFRNATRYDNIHIDSVGNAKTMINAQSHRLPILIVGGGPVGLFLAHALSQLEGA